MHRAIRGFDSRKTFLAVVVSLAILFVLSPSLSFAEKERDEGYFSIMDEKSHKIIMQTGLWVSVGDRFLDSDNRLYEIKKVVGDNAYASLVEEVDLKPKVQKFRETQAAELAARAGGTRMKGAQGRRRMLVATYHTHSDESYIPTDGSPSIEPRGGIYKVGATATASMERFGVDVLHSYAVHLPHDGAAYERSRRTVMQLLKHNPDAIFDIHRDSAPLEQYATVVNGEPGAKVMIVVGRENPNMGANEQFAYAVKDFADRNFPGLIRGIFYGAGDYNQDLSPHALLFEVGSHENSRYAAERGIAAFINAIPALLYGLSAPPPQGRTPGAMREQAGRIARERSGALRSLLWIIVTVVVVGLAYLLVNEGSWDGVKRRLIQLKEREFADLLGGGRRSKRATGNGGSRGDGRSNDDEEG